MASHKKQANGEVILFLCSDHFDFDLTISFSGYKFNCLPSFDSNQCEIEGCLNGAFYRFIGIKIPDICPDLSLKCPILAPDELYMEAVKALTKGPAIDKLTSYLYFKTRTYVYASGDLAAVLVIKQLSRLLLKELKIEENGQMSVRQVSSILKYLKVYPIDYLESNEKPAE